MAVLSHADFLWLETSFREMLPNGYVKLYEETEEVCFCHRVDGYIHLKTRWILP